jgi:hypothetical protein
MRVEREDRAPVGVGQIEQRPAQAERARHQAEHQFPLPHPVHRHVDVVA